MDGLPNEIVYQILECLDQRDLVQIQRVSRRYLPLARDTALWRAHCYEESAQHTKIGALPLHSIHPRSTTGSSWSTLDIARLVPGLNSSSLFSPTPPGSDTNLPEADRSETDVGKPESFRDKRARAISEWDPSYENEEVDWYSECIARLAQPSVSWLEQPGDGTGETKELRDVRGIGYLKDGDEQGDDYVVGPLEDGSLCIWDLRDSNRGTRYSPELRGKLIGRSNKGLLFDTGGDVLSGSPGFVGVDECVSIDSIRKKVYVAVHNTLNEVDLETMQVVNQERYPFFISALSECRYPTPLTIGTTLSLHLHDPRQSRNSFSSSTLGATTERLDRYSSSYSADLPSSTRNDFHRLFSGDAMPEYASLFHPNPLSILHLPRPTNPTIVSDDILVAGRFPSILHYERRTFPRLMHTLHSGARLSSLSSLPYPPRLPLLPSDPSPTSEISTIIAAGEYNGRGSLELYTFPPSPGSSTSDRQQSFHSPATPPSSPSPLTSYKNRQTTSASKLLCCVPHGTRILFSDADGTLKWVERDGHSIVRRWNVNSFDINRPTPKFQLRHGLNSRNGTGPAPGPRMPPTPQPFDFDTTDANSRILPPPPGPLTFSPVGTDVVRKIIPTNRTLNHDRLLLWTGEKIGSMRFMPEPEWAWDEWEDFHDDISRGNWNADSNKGEAAVYEHLMRKALERQADEVRWMGRLGLG